MWQDPVVAETRALRDEYAREFNYDVAAIYKDLLAKQQLHPERMVSLPSRKPVVTSTDSQQHKDIDLVLNSKTKMSQA